MNRVLGDYFETLLYKIFVSIDENTTVAEVSRVIQKECNNCNSGLVSYILLH